MTSLRPLVFAEAAVRGPEAPAKGSDAPRAPRTLRSLRFAEFEPVDLAAATLSAIDSTSGPVWLVRAGAWLCSPPPIALPPPSPTGLPLCALGRTFAAPDGEEDRTGACVAWEELVCSTGGALDEHVRAHRPLPRVDSVFLEAALAGPVLSRLAAGEALAEALSEALVARPCRVVRDATLDVFFDAGLRVAEVVTSVQQGGAERLAIDLARELPRAGIASRLFAVWRPSRQAFKTPPHTVDLGDLSVDRDTRFRLLAAEMAAWGADLAHAHLFPREDILRLREHGYRPMVTVHNTRAGWPPDIESTGPDEVAVLVGCARAVEREIAQATPSVPVRAVWNGVEIGPPVAGTDLFGGAAARSTDGEPRGAAPSEETRRRLGAATGDLVLLALANPRPQKRLHLLPEIVLRATARLAERGSPRRVLLWVAGDTLARSPAAQEALAAFRAEITRCGVEPLVRMLGSVDDTGALLRACDVLVSPSAHEGLSLSHLEALLCGRPVVATGAGGTAEVAALCPGLLYVPDPDSDSEVVALGADRHAPGDDPSVATEALNRAERRGALVSRFADAVVRAALDPPSDPGAVAVHFSARRMAEGYARLATRAAASPAPRRGLLLVTNNLSTGGAQSSARRLLTGLFARGIPVAAALLEEQPRYPTKGRRALEEAGIPTLALPPPDVIPPAESVRRIAEWTGHLRPEAVLFWNAIFEHKLLLADALFDLPVFDVSPGEMYFASLERYFRAPRPGLPYLAPRDYGARLAGAIVKYGAEADLAARVLGAKVHVVPNGVDLAPLGAPRARAPLLLGTAARLHPHKRLEDLLAAVRLAAPRLPPFRLRVAGGPDRGQEAHAAALRAASADLPVDWVGEQEGSQTFLQDLDVFCLVSEPAGCPNASLEALAAGLPVVATDVGGMSEQIEDGVSGRLVARGDIAGLAAAIEEVAGDARLRERLGLAGRQRVSERFSMERMLDGYCRVCLDGS